VANREPYLVTTPEAEAHLEAEPNAERDPEPADENVLDELLVEEVSIDGMCGVY
jgi:mycofactocin precursor